MCIFNDEWCPMLWAKYLCKVILNKAIFNWIQFNMGYTNHQFKINVATQHKELKNTYYIPKLSIRTVRLCREKLRVTMDNLGGGLDGAGSHMSYVGHGTSCRWDDLSITKAWEIKPGGQTSRDAGIEYQSSNVWLEMFDITRNRFTWIFMCCFLTHDYRVGGCNALR